MHRKVDQFIGSIQLAIPLLSIIGVVLIGATFLETQVGSETVQQEIYKSPWFGSLMFLLAVNLGVSALNRYPWRSLRKMGFALTHLGLIVLIAGSAAVIHLSVEGMLLLRTDSGPNQIIRLGGDRLEVATPDGNVDRKNIFVKANGTVRPRKFGSLALLRYSENSIESVSFTSRGPVRNPALELSLKSARMGQSLDLWLAAAPVGYEKQSLGPASLELMVVDSEAELLALLEPPSSNSRPLDQSQDYFRAIVGPEGKLFYTANSSTGFLSGGLEIGSTVSPGWADFQITLSKYIEDAQLHRQVVPVDNPGFEGVPALLVQGPDGTTQWLPWGQGTTIATDARQIYAAFGPALLDLPFAIALEDFIIERNEGSDAVAMWTSKIRIIEGDRSISKDVWMNHPARYHGWKISQASWNPGDLQQSTLQVKREPLWADIIIWSGSLLVISGITVMFYGRAIAKIMQELVRFAVTPPGVQTPG